MPAEHSRSHLIYRLPPDLTSPACCVLPDRPRPPRGLRTIAKLRSSMCAYQPNLRLRSFALISALFLSLLCEETLAYLSDSASAQRTRTSLHLSESSRHRTTRTMPRKQFLAAAAFSSLAIMGNSQPAFAFSSSQPVSKVDPVPPLIITTTPSAEKSDVAYRALSLDFGPGVTVPVAVWHPVNNAGTSSSGRLPSMPPPANAAGRGLLTETATYSHRISVAKIGDLLAGWDFIPSFASRSFELKPTLTSAKVYAAPRTNVMPLPSSGPVVILAHGFLGSRFDLSHLAEELASQGFIVVSPEMPESLAASYPRTDGIDRASIVNKLLDAIENDWMIRPSSFGIVGHSLGTGTVISSGDDSWTRVSIAGKPSERPSPALFIGSKNDGAVSLSRIGALPSDYVMLDEDSITSRDTPLPSKAALIFDRPDAPNHISFLAEGPNDAMVQFLSPLLPVAQAMEIPVLDFDKYAKVRDSRSTAEKVVPLVSRYLKENMKVD